MPDSFDAVEFLRYLRRRWRFPALATVLAVGATAAGSLLLPRQFTANATLVIEPPGANDPRSATAVSSVYLESLKSYEQLAASDSLFARACDKFGLLRGEHAPSMEPFKQKVLRVAKLKDTKILRISVTLPDPERAQQVAQYLAEQTVWLNHFVTAEGDAAAVRELQNSLVAAQAKLEEARTAYNRVSESGLERRLSEDLNSLADLKARTSVERVRSRTAVAEMAALHEQTASEEARGAALEAELARLDASIAERSAALAKVRAEQDRAADALRSAEAIADTWQRRYTELAAGVGSHSEQLRIVDRGIVPQRPSFPNIPLFTAAALALSAMLSFLYLSLCFGLKPRRMERAEVVPSTRVA